MINRRPSVPSLIHVLRIAYLPRLKKVPARRASLINEVESESSPGYFAKHFP